MKLPRFALISGFGWLIDVGGMSTLVALGTPPFLANCISAALAVTFVFSLAQRHVFVHQGSGMGRKFVLYVAWNATVILLASAAVGFLAGMATAQFPAFAAEPSGRVMLALGAKVCVTPVTLYCNFLFMGWLLEGRASAY